MLPCVRLFVQEDWLRVSEPTPAGAQEPALEAQEPALEVPAYPK